MLIALVLLWCIVLLDGGVPILPPRRCVQTSVPTIFLWVFLVPALNEEVTIADSVARLRQVDRARQHKIILVVDDGSDDGTGAILADLETEASELSVIDVRHQRRGRAIGSRTRRGATTEALLAQDRWSEWPRDRVIVVVVDADGRLDPHAPSVLAARFADDRFGGVQCRVRIYNRQRLLTWLQDVEFGVYRGLFQAGLVGSGASPAWEGTARPTGSPGARRPACRGGHGAVAQQAHRGSGPRSAIAARRMGGAARSFGLRVDQQGLPGLRPTASGSAPAGRRATSRRSD